MAANLLFGGKGGGLAEIAGILIPTLGLAERPPLKRAFGGRKGAEAEGD